MITQTFHLNLIPEQGPTVIHCDQYDEGTGRLIIKLYDGDVAYSPSGTAIIQGRKPDGKGFTYSATLSGNTVTADLTKQMTAVAGPVRCQVVVTESPDRTGTFVFILQVQKSALPDDTDMSASDYQLIEQAIEDAQVAVEDSQEAAEDAEAWAVGERGGIPVGPTDPTFHNNSKWWADQAASIGDLDDLGDVTISSPSNGQVLTYNSVTQEWENDNPQAGASSLDDLTDVTISSPTDGQVLKYNSVTQEWENANESGGGGDYVGLYGMTEIQSSDGQGTTAIDLDTYTTVGNYFCNAKGKITVQYYYDDNTRTNVQGTTWSNAIFILVVKKFPNNHLMQEIAICTDVGGNSYYNRYIRYKGDGGWTYWSRQGSTTTYGISLNLNRINDVNISSAADGDVLVYNSGATKWENKPINVVTNFAVSLTGWTVDTTSQSGTTLYKKQIPVNNVWKKPNVSIGCGTGYGLPTAAEQESFNLIQYAKYEGDTSPYYVELYASAIPTTAFYVDIEGVD